MALLKLDRLGARERWGLGLALAFALVLLVDRLVVTMVTHRIRAVEGQMARESKELAYNRRVLRSKGPIEAEYERIEALLASGLPDSEAINQVMGEVDDLALGAGIDVKKREHRPSVASRGYTEFLVEINEFESSMANLLTFLHRVWETPGMLRVKRITVGPAGEEGVVEGSAVISKILISGG